MRQFQSGLEGRVRTSAGCLLEAMGDCSLFLQTLNLDGEGWGRKKGRVQFPEAAEQAEYCEQGES